MQREDDFQDQQQQRLSGSANRSDSAQRAGFAYQRSPTMGFGLRQPTQFNKSDYQDRPAAQGSGLPKAQPSSTPAVGTSVEAANSIPAHLIEEANAAYQTPQVISYREPAEESLLMATPQTSEKKSMLNSMLSDDEMSATSHFEPTQTRQSVTTASARKKANRTSMAALSVTAQKDNVKVVIRVRPINEREKGGGPLEKVKQCLVVERNEKLILDRGMDQKTFTFDFVATHDSEQSELFSRIAQPIADSCLQGYNGTIFAYGQTGSGKTFTIQGPTILINGEETLIGASASNNEMHEKRGLMQRSFEYIFDCMESEKQEALKQGIEMTFLLKTSYLEIYNEQIMDLLDPQSYNLHVREDIKKGVYVEGLNEETVTGVKEMMNLTTRGARNRHVGSTLMNKESSRSHSVLTTTIESKTMNDDGVWQMKSSRFHIIDLAGSERSKNTKAVGERLKEAGMINKSLTALGIVINSLVEVSEGKKRHVHYRDSKLTFLLRDSLGGNSKTVIIANVTAAAISVGETLSTLKFAQRAKLIKNKAVINEESSSTIHLLKQELRQVKKILAEQSNQLKIAHEQLEMKESIPEAQEESMDATPSIISSICRVCNKDISAQDRSESDDVTLQFVDTSAIYNTYDGGQNSKSSVLLNNEGGGMNDSAMLDMNEKTPGGTATGMQGLKQQNPKAFKMYRQRTAELAQMKDRVGKVEKLLAENLENMDIQQTQYEQQIESLAKSNKEKQIALEASEKNRARDKMIIKFREERITDLEARLAKANENLSVDAHSTSASEGCGDCASLTKQLNQAHHENSQWLECAETNPQAAKLFAEKQELLAAKQALQKELKVTPESLTARIRGLNELTNNLNYYLKEYCAMEGFEKLKQELEASKDELQGKVVSLETDMSDKTAQHAEQVKALAEEHEEKQRSLTEKLDQLRETFESERVKIEQYAQDQMTQLKSDLDATLAEKGELQQEVQAKVEAHEKQIQLQKSIDQLTKTLEELQGEKEGLEGQLKGERESKERASDLWREAEATLNESMEKLKDQMEDEKQQLGYQLKDLEKKTNEEIQDLEKEIAVTKEESRMHEERNADIERQVRSTQEENDQLQKQALEVDEEIQEKRRHVREIETKLNQVIKECQTKNEKLQELQRQIAEVQTQYQQSMETNETISSEREAEKEAILANQEQIALLSLQITTASEQLASNEQEKISKNSAYEEVNVQMKAMEELTVSLTQQANEKDSEISKLRSNVTEKDLEMAQALREFDENQNIIKQSLVHEQSQTEELKSHLTQLRDSLAETQQQAFTRKEELESQIRTLETHLQTEKENLSKASQKADVAQTKLEGNLRASERMVEQIKQEMTTATQNYKFGLELEYQTKLSNKEKELRSTMATNQSKDQEVVLVQQQEIQKLRMDLSKVKQARQMALMDMQQQVSLLKQSQSDLVHSVSQEMTWKRVGPKLNVITSLVDQVKLVSREHTAMKQYQQDCQELQEQLTEYKGLTQQLQEEKRNLNGKLHENLQFVETAKIQNEEIIESLNAQLQTTQTELAEAHQMLQQSKTVAEESIKTLHSQKVEQFQTLSEESRLVITRLQEEAEQLRQSRSEAQNDLLKYKSKASEQSNLLMNSKETISSMVSKENQLMTDLKRKITELGEQQEQYKARVTQFKQEKEAITSKYETLKKENENLRELIKIKDGQIEDSRGYEQERRGERERLYGDVRKQKEMLQKRENEIKELVLTLKAFADEKKRLEKELERVRTQDMHTGHNNQAQKIQHHLRIKEENNKLREENFALQEQVRRFLAQQQPGGASTAMNSNATFGNLASEANAQHQPTQQLMLEAEKGRKEVQSLHESISKLAEGLLKMPGVGQFVSSNEQLATHFKKHALPQGTSSTSSSSYYATQKLKGTSEVIVNICKQLQARVQECNQMTQEFKRMEQEIHQLQMEKSMILQQNPQLAAQLPQRMAPAQGGGGTNTVQQSSLQGASVGSTMQPSFQVQRSITQQQQSLGSQGGSNQYRRQSSRGAAATQQQSAEPNSQQQPNLAARQMHLMQQQQSMNRM